MVALNSDFAASKSDTDTKNRVGRFFSLAAESVGEDRRSSRKCAGEKRGYRYDTTSVDTEFEYGPFGELIRATGAKKDDFNFRFSTKYEDTETGLLYYGYRYYNAEIGRWLNRDPIGEYGGANLYCMVGNSPLNFLDYLGLKINAEIFEEYEWKYNNNIISMIFCGCDPFEVDRALSIAFRGFTKFDYPNISVNSDGIDDRGVGIVKFEPGGVGGFFNSWFGHFGGIGDTHDVTTFGPKAGTGIDQRAITNPWHGLVGIRLWGHNIFEPDSKYFENSEIEYFGVTGWTMAYETWNNVGGWVPGLGAEDQINKTAKLMWADYLQDTLMGVLNDLNCKDIKIIIESSDYYTPPAFDRFIQDDFKNPFLHQIPEAKDQ